MKNVDVELIQRVLNGDDTAFSALVRKYQKSVHALAWRKIGDFHIAEDITQDTFLKAYQELSTLKEPQSFASWLYVIAANRCTAWLRKKRLWTQSLENTNSAELEKATYSNYVITENERAAADAQREVVKKLLAKLQESDRTVITLYYLGGMTYEEISRFLGVSVSAIKNRLYRARQHLKKEEPMIREALENFQITPHLTENIMREISRIKPATPTGSKPLVPWAIAASSAILIVLMLGIGSQHLLRFQQPYSLDAQAEMTIELVDAPIVRNLDTKPDVRRQFGNLNALGESDSSGQKPDEIILAAAQAEGEDVSVSKQQWIQSEPIKGSPASSFFATPEGDFYTHVNGNLFKLPVNEQKWQHIFGIWTLNTGRGGDPPIAKWKNTLYIIPSNELFASKDDGQTWDLVHSWSDQHSSIKLILTEQAFYVAFENGTIFRSEDTGKTWEELNEGIMGHIGSLVKIQNTLFAGTDTGLYRLNADSWERIKFPVPNIGDIESVAATEEKLYVAAGLSWDVLNPTKVAHGQQRAWWVFSSIDLGNSWQDITPTNAWPVKGFMPYIKLIAAGETLLVMERGMVRSADGGNTWMPPQLEGTSPKMNTWSSAVVVNTDTIYVGSEDGLHRSTDGGKSWEIVKITPDERGIDNLITFKEANGKKNMRSTLYGRVGEEIVKTTDRGKSWKTIPVEIPMTEPDREDQPWISKIVKSDGVIYAKSGDFHNREDLRLYRVSADGRTLVPIQDMPFLKSGAMELRHLQRNNNLFDLPDKPLIEQLQEKFSGAAQFFKQVATEPATEPQKLNTLINLGFQGPFAISGDTFFMECHFKLFRWKSGDTEWSETGVEETVKLTIEIAWRDLRLAVSGNTVYVGKRDGHLVVSFDKGNNWIDLTPALPFSFKIFKKIVFSGPTVYVATDAGVAASDSGKNWQAVTDSEGTNLIMEKLAVDGTTLYGVIEKTGVYRLESGTWEQVVSEIPDSVTSLAVDGDTLYVGTGYNEMLHFNLEE